MSRLRAIILGCGSSGGVPRIGGPDGAGDWGACDPEEPKNRRRRCSLAIQRADDDRGWDAPELTTVLIDTSPDLREQLLSARIDRLAAVFFTHDHADQCHGLDDLRALAINQRARVPVYYGPTTSPELTTRFAYCFNDNPATGYPAILDAHEIDAAETCVVDGPTGPIPVTPFLVEHGPVPSFGYRIGGEGGFAYAPDCSGIPDRAFPLLSGLDTFIVDALRHTPHPSHAHVEKALGWIERTGAARGVLTNLHVDLDYRTLDAETPAHVTPAFDGMEIETDDAA